MTPGWLLHTAAARDLIAGRGKLRARVLEQAHPRLGISVMTQAQLQESVARLPVEQQSDMAMLVEEFFRWVEILPWDAAAASCYATVRLEQTISPQADQRLSDIDLMLAAQAIALELPLICGDARFSAIAGLTRIDWSV